MDTYALRPPTTFSHLRRAASRALTLIEMMIVVAIIGLIAGLVIMQYSHAIDKSDVTVSAMELKQIAGAIDNYRLDYHAYPPGPLNNYTTVNPVLFGGAGNAYMNSTPTDTIQPFEFDRGWNNSYVIRDDRPYDGSMLHMFKDLSGNDNNQTPGTFYRLFYSPYMGVATCAC